MKTCILKWLVVVLFSLTVSEFLYAQNDYKVKKAQALQDSLRANQFRRQGITNDVLETLRSKGINIDNQNVKEPEPLTIFSELIIQGTVIKDPKEVEFPCETDRTWGTVRVEVRISKILKHKNVDSDEHFSAGIGDIIEVFDIQHANGLLLRKPTRYDDFRLRAGEEAYFFLNREVILMKSRRSNQFHCIDVLPVDRAVVKYPSPEGTVITKTPEELEKSINSILNMMLGDSHD